MSNLRQLARIKMLPAFFLLAIAALLAPSAAHAQTQYTPNCASAIVDPYGEVENTVCISGNSSDLDFYQEVDNFSSGNAYNQWYPYVYATSTIYENLTAIGGDNSGSGLYGSASTEESLTPTIDEEYRLDGDASGCYDETNGNNPSGCSSVDFGYLEVELSAS